jgi:hypothetical protein
MYRPLPAFILSSSLPVGAGREPAKAMTFYDFIFAS